ncbi:MAG TPA: ABC transporter permease subunit [Vicinamibacterales bacterium]|nr:ABC transporter permease subunit [Vicinamibacterales bacterium]
MTSGSVVWLCARFELLLAARSRWLQVFALVFAGLSLAVAASGYVLSGGHGLQDFSRTAVSLVQVVLLLAPLAALVFGGLALTPERGAAELMYSQPVSRGSILAGRALGVWLALSAAQLIGFGAAGSVVQWQSGGVGASHYAALALCSIAVTAVFVGIAAWLAACSPGRRTRVLALSLVIWFMAVILFDVAALGVASLLRSGSASRVLITATLVNPIDAARTGVLLAIDGTAAFGAASLALLRFTGGMGMTAALIAASLVVWLLAPFALALRALSRSDI